MSSNEAKVKELARLPGNKACFDCGRTGIQNTVVLDFSTFVCSQCAGIHRNFGHKIKSINISNFSADEVSKLTDGGNKKAAKFWLSSYDEGAFKREPEDPKNIERFMRIVYEDKKFCPKEDDEKKKKKQAKLERMATKASLNAPVSSSGSPAPSVDFLAQTPKSLSSSSASDPFSSSFHSDPFSSSSSSFESDPFKGSSSSSGSSTRRDSFSSFGSSDFSASTPRSSQSSTSQISSPSTSHPAVALLLQKLKEVQREYNLHLNDLQSYVQQAMNQLKAVEDTSSGLARVSSSASSASSASASQPRRDSFSSNFPLVSSSSSVSTSSTSDLFTLTTSPAKPQPSFETVFSNSSTASSERRSSFGADFPAFPSSSVSSSTSAPSFHHQPQPQKVASAQPASDPFADLPAQVEEDSDSYNPFADDDEPSATPTLAAPQSGRSAYSQPSLPAAHSLLQAPPSAHALLLNQASSFSQQPQQGMMQNPLLVQQQLLAAQQQQLLLQQQMANLSIAAGQMPPSSFPQPVQGMMGQQGMPQMQQGVNPLFQQQMQQQQQFGMMQSQPQPIQAPQSSHFAALDPLANPF